MKLSLRCLGILLFDFSEGEIFEKILRFPGNSGNKEHSDNLSSGEIQGDFEDKNDSSDVSSLKDIVSIGEISDPEAEDGMVIETRRKRVIRKQKKIGTKVNTGENNVSPTRNNATLDLNLNAVLDAQSLSSLQVNDNRVSRKDLNLQNEYEEINVNELKNSEKLSSKRSLNGGSSNDAIQNQVQPAIDLHSSNVQTSNIQQADKIQYFSHDLAPFFPESNNKTELDVSSESQSNILEPSKSENYSQKFIEVSMPISSQAVDTTASDSLSSLSSYIASIESSSSSSEPVDISGRSYVPSQLSKSLSKSNSSVEVEVDVDISPSLF